MKSSLTNENIEDPLADAQAIFQSTPKFMIYLILSIYKELSLTELSKMIKRKKSTLSAHLKQMIAQNFVEIAKEVKVRGDKKAKYYKLVENVDERINEHIYHAQNNPNPEQEFLHTLQIRSLFAEVNIQFLKKWQNYNDSLANEIIKGNYKSIENELKSLKQPSKDSVIYSQHVQMSNFYAEQLKTRVYEEFRDNENKMLSEESKSSEFFRSAFCSFNIIPIKKILDHYLEKIN